MRAGVFVAWPLPMPHYIFESRFLKTRPGPIAEVIQNPLGTAPGFRMPVTLNGHTANLIVMPGVPREMKPMMENSVIPWINANRGTDKVYAVRVFQTFGISESALDEAVRSGRLTPGMTVMFVAFGAGFTWASLVLQW